MLSTRTCQALNADRACLDGPTSSTAVEPSKPSSRESQAIGSDLHGVDDPCFTPGGYEFKRMRSEAPRHVDVSTSESSSVAGAHPMQSLLIKPMLHGGQVLGG